MKIFFTFFLLCFSLSVQGKGLKCLLNISRKTQTVSSSDLKKIIKEFTIEKSNRKPVRVDLGKVHLLVWPENNEFQVLLKDDVLGTQVRTSYTFTKNEISLTLSKGPSLTCYSPNKWNTVKDQGVHKHFQRKLDGNSLLDQYGKRIRFGLKKDLNFYYRQQNVVGKMRPVIFQNGETYTADMEINRQENWCVLQVQMKLEENITVARKTKLNVIDFQKFSNNDTFDTYSFSFVDLNTGKKTQETPYYAPFSLDCNLRKGLPFKLSIFNLITGNLFEVDLSE